MRYGWGLNLFPRTALARARSRTESCVKSLVGSNLLVESDHIGCVRMHDLARAFALSDSTEVKQASIVKHDDVSQQLMEEANESYQRILLKCTGLSEFPLDFNCPNLTFFKVMDGDKELNFPDNFYSGMGKLAVLSYEETLHAPLPPRSSQCFTHLRTLCLHGCQLISDHWTVIEDLVNLEVLSFANSGIRTLSSVIVKLKKLKLLDLTGCVDLHIDNGVFRSLNKLEELYMKVAREKAITFTNAVFDELVELLRKLSTLEVEFIGNKDQLETMSFKNLERFKISIGCLLKQDMDVYSFRNTMKLVTNSSDLLNCEITELFKKTEELHVEVKGMKHLTDVITTHPPQDSFSKLRFLVVDGCNDLKYLFTVAMASGLKKLERLTVSSCDVLESLIRVDESENDEAGVIIFKELKSLSLFNLPKLGSLCDMDKVVKLPQLVELKLWSLPSFTCIYADNAMQLFFKKEIEDVSDHSSKHPFSNLRVLQVISCIELRYLFTVAMASGLRKLEKLEVVGCDVLESLIHGDESENDGVVKFQELKYLRLEYLPKLESLCEIELPQLEELRLENLPKVTSIYPDGAMQPLFNKQVAPKLEKLYIWSMENLKQIWPSEITTSGEEVQNSMLRVVEVRHCDSLVNLFPINPMPLLRNLEKIQVSYCSSIQVLFNIDLGCVAKIEEVSSSLRSIEVTNSEDLTVVWRIKGANNSQISGFQAVEKIRIHGCRRFRNVFIPATTNFDMKAHLDTDIQDSDDSLFSKALKSLQPDNEATKIALCGMGSVGKTKTMEDLVEAVEGMFDLVLKLNIGREANPIALQEATTKFIGEDLTEATKEARAEHLHKRFMQISQDGKTKILVILDDLWEVLNLKDIGLSSSPLPNGFKLLITSRDLNVCAQMGVEKSSVFRLGFVDDAEAKTLFFESVGLLEDDDPDLYCIGEEIIRRCGNFPISLKAIASVLKGDIKDKSKWEEALSHLRNHELEDIYYVMKIAFDISYNNLKDDKRAILFLCGFFPKGFHIPVEELMRYAWGLKLFPTSTTLAQARHRIKASVDVLIHANFLTECGEVGHYKMQEEARDFVLGHVTNKVKQAVIDNGNMVEGANESCERIFLECPGTSEFPVALNYPNLKLLKLTGENKEVKFRQDFYDRMENLDVVAYERIVDPLLPPYLANLRTLCLNSCSLTYDFSFLGDLINLEILSFVGCNIQKLPSTIGKLKRLKLLNVIKCDDLHIEDGVFQNLVNLEELYMRADDESRISFTDANYKELDILSKQLCVLEVELYENKLHSKHGSFEKLEKFRISMGRALGYCWGDMHSCENTLKLLSNCSEIVECKMNELFEKTEMLYLAVEDMKNVEDVSMHYYSFCNLRRLEVSDCRDLTSLFTVEVASGLTKLESLEVSSCPVLETLIDGESGSSMITFLKLKYLSLKKLPKITTIFPGNASIEAYALFNKQVQIPNLEELRIEYMEKLMQIWPYEYTTVVTGSDQEEEEEVLENISMLRVIVVFDCDSLENLFPCNPLPLLNHLERLHVISCCSIKVLFNMDLSRGAAAGAGNIINEPTSSLRYIEVRESENVREIWRIKGVSNNNSSSSSALLTRCFQAVEEIYVWKCKRFRDLFFPKSINLDTRARVNLRRN